MRNTVVAVGLFAGRAFLPLRRTEEAQGWWQLLITVPLPIGTVLAQVRLFLDGSWVLACLAIAFIALLFLIEGVRTRWTLDGIRKASPRIEMSIVDHPFPPTVDFSEGRILRVKIENVTPHSMARNLSIRLTESLPEIPLSFPVTLHRMHDNPKTNQPYELRHNLRYREPIVFDVISCGEKGDPPMFYIYRADPDFDSQSTCEWMLSDNDNLIIATSAESFGGWYFKLSAVGDPPAEPVEKWFRVTLLDGQWPSFAEVTHPSTNS